MCTMHSMYAMCTVYTMCTLCALYTLYTLYTLYHTRIHNNVSKYTIAIYSNRHWHNLSIVCFLLFVAYFLLLPRCIFQHRQSMSGAAFLTSLYQLANLERPCPSPHQSSTTMTSTKPTSRTSAPRFHFSLSLPPRTFLGLDSRRCSMRNLPRFLPAGRSQPTPTWSQLTPPRSWISNARKLSLQGSQSLQGASLCQLRAPSETQGMPSAFFPTQCVVWFPFRIFCIVLRDTLDLYACDKHTWSLGGKPHEFMFGKSNHDHRQHAVYSRQVGNKR